MLLDCVVGRFCSGGQTIKVSAIIHVVQSNLNIIYIKINLSDQNSEKEEHHIFIIFITNRFKYIT